MAVQTEHPMNLRAITVTVDVEDPRPSPDWPKRYDRVTRRILDLFETLNVRATFFVVGNLALQDAGLIREIGDRGHEVGLHSLEHVPITRWSRKEFQHKSGTGKKLLEDIGGRAVIGFRAPVFSLTPKCFWATEVLTELGFRYSSSVLPAKTPFFCFPDAPRVPFVWPSGLLEFPAPVGRFGPMQLPYLGGIYLRYLPGFLVSRQIRRADHGQFLWCYCHPHDFDAGEPFYRIRNTSLATSLVLWFNRRSTFDKLQGLLSGSFHLVPGPPFAEVIESRGFGGLETYHPVVGQSATA